MAEAVVEDPIMNRFFCHECSTEIPRVLEDYTCPTCLGGFIEELDGPSTISDDTSDDHSEDELEDLPPLDFINETIGQELGDILFNLRPRFQDRDRERRVTRSRDNETNNTEDGTPVRSGGRYRTPTHRNRGRLSRGREIYPRLRSRPQFIPPLLNNNRLNIAGMSLLRDRPSQQPRGRDLVPIEHMIQDFIVNLTGVGWGPMGPGGRGNGPVFFLGNPGDYAWGREGLDAIVTQLLNQMDGTGPPPLDKDKIKEIPTTIIQQEHVDTNLQCSVCWEDFKVGEGVRKLQCEHLYHEPCIVPWLELHGTCPICRKSLSSDTDENAQQNQEPSLGLAAFLRENASNSSRTSSTSSTASSSSNSTTSSSSTAGRPPQSSDTHMELDFD